MEITAIAGQDQFGAFIEYNGFRSAMPNYELAVYVVNALNIQVNTERATIHHGLTINCPTPNQNGSCPGHLALDIAQGQNLGR